MIVKVQDAVRLLAAAYDEALLRDDHVIDDLIDRGLLAVTPVDEVGPRGSGGGSVRRPAPVTLTAQGRQFVVDVLGSWQDVHDGDEDGPRLTMDEGDAQQALTDELARITEQAHVLGDPQSVTFDGDYVRITGTHARALHAALEELAEHRVTLPSPRVVITVSDSGDAIDFKVELEPALVENGPNPDCHMVANAFLTWLNERMEFAR